MSPIIQSLVALGVCVLLSLACAALAAKWIRYGKEKAKINAKFFGVNTVITGGIATWLGSFIIIVSVWWNVFYPAFVSTEVWSVTGDLLYREFENDTTMKHVPDERINVSMRPPGHSVAGGTLDLQLPVDPTKDSHNKFPVLVFGMGDCYIKTIVNLNKLDVDAFDHSSKVVNFGRVEIDRLPPVRQELIPTADGSLARKGSDSVLSC